MGCLLAVPTLIAGIYGMNFAHMPELDWRYGYPCALAAMALGADCCTGPSAETAGLTPRTAPPSAIGRAAAAGRRVRHDRRAATGARLHWGRTRSHKWLCTAGVATSATRIAKALRRRTHRRCQEGPAGSV
ncbi:hypothetical protein E4K10_00060 [Streptomyces sp. T1317-0309]|nr:hypothetical protein E4K10_00060 [Streptomyces sp. T1317-0309]